MHILAGNRDNSKVTVAVHTVDHVVARALWDLRKSVASDVKGRAEGKDPGARAYWM